MLKLHQSFSITKSKDTAYVLTLSLSTLFSRTRSNNGLSSMRYTNANSKSASMFLLLCTLQEGMLLDEEETLGASCRSGKFAIVELNSLNVQTFEYYVQSPLRKNITLQQLKRITNIWHIFKHSIWMTTSQSWKSLPFWQSQMSSPSSGSHQHHYPSLLLLKSIATTPKKLN